MNTLTKGSDWSLIECLIFLYSIRETGIIDKLMVSSCGAKCWQKAATELFTSKTSRSKKDPVTGPCCLRGREGKGREGARVQGEGKEKRRGEEGWRKDRPSILKPQLCIGIPYLSLQVYMSHIFLQLVTNSACSSHFHTGCSCHEASLLLYLLVPTCSPQHSFGFITCCERNESIFFHFSQYNGNTAELRPGGAAPMWAQTFTFPLLTSLHTHTMLRFTTLPHSHTPTPTPPSV